MTSPSRALLFLVLEEKLSFAEFRLTFLRACASGERAGNSFLPEPADPEGSARGRGVCGPQDLERAVGRDKKAASPAYLGIAFQAPQPCSGPSDVSHGERERLPLRSCPQPLPRSPSASRFQCPPALEGAWWLTVKKASVNTDECWQVSFRDGIYHLFRLHIAGTQWTRAGRDTESDTGTRRTLRQGASRGQQPRGAQDRLRLLPGRPAPRSSQLALRPVTSSRLESAQDPGLPRYGCLRRHPPLGRFRNVAVESTSSSKGLLSGRRRGPPGEASAAPAPGASPARVEPDDGASASSGWVGSAPSISRHGRPAAPPSRNSHPVERATDQHPLGEGTSTTGAGPQRRGEGLWAGPTEKLAPTGPAIVQGFAPWRGTAPMRVGPWRVACPVGSPRTASQPERRLPLPHVC
ncbi:uncharacterized protein LOC132527963 [Lagenorhynchus albirostris]|uniref:uncharacterized protein LOC132527963 n=1 Tax=Lagenorhynchus albirostris TaxID=27610 RepID=UPI0028E1E6EC|nr:uncharacterized protein LOC132527963 [Lagenorhynchus albirostris]